jgi:hypothetical protein
VPARILLTTPTLISLSHSLTIARSWLLRSTGSTTGLAPRALPAEEEITRIRRTVPVVVSGASPTRADSSSRPILSGSITRCWLGTKAFQRLIHRSSDDAKVDEAAFSTPDVVRWRAISGRRSTAEGIDRGQWTRHELLASFGPGYMTTNVLLEQFSLLIGHKSTALTELVYRQQIGPLLQDSTKVMDSIFGGGRE